MSEPRYKSELDKSLIYDSATNKDICMYFDDDTRDMLLELLNRSDDIENKNSK